MPEYNVNKKEVECLFAWSMFYQDAPGLFVGRNKYIVQSKANTNAFVNIQKRISILQKEMYSSK